METAHKAAVVAAISSPWWIDPLHSLSDIAGYLMPIFGFVFLIAQMIVWFRKQRNP